MKKYSWHVQYAASNNEYYASATKYFGRVNGKFKYQTIQMHRYIMDVVDCDDYDVDHINHNVLDNRKQNLRITEHKQNMSNRNGKNKNNKSGYRNVSWNGSKWIVQVQINGRNTCVGRFKENELEEAKNCARVMRQKYYGEFAGN